jgi:hypothetical protein
LFTGGNLRRERARRLPPPRCCDNQKIDKPAMTE